MVRPMRESDMPRMKELEGEFVWEFGPDLMECLVYVDDNDVPRMFAGAWRRAEVHATIDSRWQTPGVRLIALKELHEAMELRLRHQGVGRVVTWMDGMKGFCRRLASFGWVKSDMVSWTREVGKNG